MGWERWVIDNIIWVAGAVVLISFILQWLITWLFRNSAQKNQDE